MRTYTFSKGNFQLDRQLNEIHKKIYIPFDDDLDIFDEPDGLLAVSVLI